MHGLPPGFDASFFVGRTLEHICASATILTLHFDDKLSVAVESGYSMYIGNAKTTSQETRANRSSPPRVTSGLLDLIEHQISDATATREGTLTLRFDTGALLVLADESPEYESYSISYRGETRYV